METKEHWMNEYDHYTFKAAAARIAWIFQAWTGIRTLTSAMPVLHQLSYQANWKQVVMWVDYKLVDG